MSKPFSAMASQSFCSRVSSSPGWYEGWLANSTFNCNANEQCDEMEQEPILTQINMPEVGGTKVNNVLPPKAVFSSRMVCPVVPALDLEEAT